MRPRCCHEIPYERDCAKCYEEELAEELPSIDAATRTYEHLHEVVARRDKWPRDSNKPTAYELGLKLWVERMKAWNLINTGNELGGEA